MRRIAAVAIAAMLAIGARQAMAAPASPMEQCTQQWLDLKAAGKTSSLVYRVFLAGCLKALPPAAIVATKPTRSASRKTSATKPKRPNRMQVCAAQWRDMKAHDTTHGLTYRQWSSQCLRSH